MPVDEGKQAVTSQNTRAWFRRLPFRRLLRRFALWWVQWRGIIPLGIGKGLKFDAGDSNPAYALGTNEVPVQEALATHLKEGGSFYDIGANVGFFTVIGARLVGKAGKVYAFEPVPENAAVVRHNVERNGFQQVTVLEKAVSQSTGQGTLQLAHYSGGSALESAAPPPDFKGTMPVELVSIDDLIAQDDEVAPPSVVKIDVEGAEMEVLLGMTDTIARFRPTVIFEIDDRSESGLKQKWAECETFFQERGYRLQQLEQSYPETGWHVENFIALPA